MTVRAKFKVQSVTQHEGAVCSIELAAVTGGSDENKSFWKWTPSATIKMQCLNPEASEQFVPGAEVYVDFTPIPK
jgi:hypothetical protein